MTVELTEKFLAEIAGWETMKEARALLASREVLSGEWRPPMLEGTVRTAGGALRAGLFIKSRVDVENRCPCLPSRQRGMVCAHSVGVGLWVLQRQKHQAAEPPESRLQSAKPASTKRLRQQTAQKDADINLKLRVIFPLNWMAALKRGRVVLFFEGETAAGCRPLNAVPVGEYRVDAADARLLDGLELLTGGEAPAMQPFDLKSLAEFLPMLEGHPRLSAGRKTPVVVDGAPWLPAMTATLAAGGELCLQVAEPVLGRLLIPGQKLYVASENRIQPLGLPQSCAAALQGELVLERRQVPEFLQMCEVFLADESRCRTNFALEKFEFVAAAPVFSLQLAGGLAQLRARIECAYGMRVFPLGASAGSERGWMPDPESAFRYIGRDLAAESGALHRLLRRGFRGPDAVGWYELRGQDAVLDFFAREYPKLRREWKVTLEERLQRSAEENLEWVRPRFEARVSGDDWLDFRVDYASESGRRFSEAEIQQWLLSGRAHRRLGNGKVAVLEAEAVAEFKEALRDCSPEQRDGSYRLAPAHAGFLDASVRELGWEVAGDAGWQGQVQPGRVDGLAALDFGELNAVLRPYQKRGIAWLDFLRRAGFGGVLADEMGLGKTVQVLALLQTMRQAAAASQAGCGVKALVVCPTSLVFNWVQEAKRFAPDLRALALCGQERRERFDEIRCHDLIVTSYALIQRDVARYRQWKFDVVALDEAQHIKNRRTQNARAVKAVRGQHRLALTGTPMENSVLDLWSIFDFLMPGYLGSATDFRDRYELPIVKEKSREAMARLGRRLRPFVLRRTKREVATELPAQLKQTVLCPLNAEQRAVYSQVMEAGQREVLSGLDSGSRRQQMMLLKALMRLRQICCDLRLLQLPHPPEEPSGKLAVFRELLAQVLDGNHRVLVFSQFTSMLQLLRRELAEQEVDCCYLDGATKDREAAVHRFQTGAIPVFLISLKAGGAGLNLTAADTVIHFDPWWNPAAEAQATGRAHRIGQKRVVTSYKLIAEDTVEQKVLRLQERKREIIQGTLDWENPFAASLTLEDFRQLFEDKDLP